MYLQEKNFIKMSIVLPKSDIDTKICNKLSSMKNETIRENISSSQRFSNVPFQNQNNRPSFVKKHCTIQRKDSEESGQGTS